jgi:formylglycine-generating enzyme required for sulfatase activity/uncharacterized caspase-like protein
MRYFMRLVVLMGLALVAVAASPAQAERRRALSVGIDVYDNLPATEQLKKAVNDAQAIGAALKEVGFDTVVEANPTRLAFIDAWQAFLNQLEPGDTAAFFFAGHGVEVGGLNYLLPRDVRRVVPGQEKVLAAGSLRLNELMEDLRDKKVRVSLLIIDACRDNPFRDGTGRSVGGARGLTRVEAAKGSFVMYSAGEGEQALDRLPGGDADPNSVFTRALLPILKTPGLTLQEIAVRVREKVVATAQGIGREQTPAYYDRLVGRFLLKGLNKWSGPPSQTGLTPVGALTEAERAWAAVKDTASIAVLETFRRQYGSANPVYDRLAAERIEELRRQQVALFKAEEEKRDPALSVKPGSGASFRDRTADGRPCLECPEMVVVPAGGFTMGSPLGEVGRYSDEDPLRRVTIARPFAVGKFEVTRGAFAAFVLETGHSVGDKCFIGEGGKWQHRSGRSFLNPGIQQDDGHPAVCVSWTDATAFAGWLSRKTGKTYRLLTEAEWEYAARAGTSTPFWWGSSSSPSQANYDGTSTYGGGATGEYRGKTVPVDSFAANPWGLYNVHGNVWEWVQDCWNGSYNGAPTNGSAWTTGDCGRRVLRGGGWGSRPGDLRAARRSHDTTGHRAYELGFRLARTL